MQVTNRTKDEVINGRGQHVSLGCVFLIHWFIHSVILIAKNKISVRFLHCTLL